MDTNREGKRVWPAVSVLALSATLHLLLLLLPLPGPRQQAARPQALPLTVTLPDRASVRQPSEAPPTPPEQIEQQEIAKPEERQASADLPEPDSVARPEPGAPSRSGSEPESIRAQLLEAARNLGRDREQTEDDGRLAYRQLPDLPSQPGWLDRYTGRVSPSIDRWRGSDGGSSARIVTGSGQVVCVRTRAPTSAEIFNPWMSLAVPMVRLCGRERPAPPERSDPWQRLPPDQPD